MGVLGLTTKFQFICEIQAWHDKRCWALFVDSQVVTFFKLKLHSVPLLIAGAGTFVFAVGAVEFVSEGQDKFSRIKLARLVHII